MGKDNSSLERKAARESSLVKLQSLLSASSSVLIAQRSIIVPLYDELVGVDLTLKGLSYDEVLARAYPRMSDPQRLQHGLIRAYTRNAMHKLNSDMLKWLANDTYYVRGNSQLGLALRQLEAHLVTWLAKYEFWIPGKPERAVVYLADELRHGVGFPKGLDELVQAKTGSRSLALAMPG